MQLFLHLGYGLVEAQDSHNALIETINRLCVEAGQDFFGANVEKTARKLIAWSEVIVCKEKRFVLVFQ